MNSASAFEYVLLERMLEPYRTRKLAELGISRNELIAKCVSSPLTYPNLFGYPMDRYESLLAPASEVLDDGARRYWQYPEHNQRLFETKLWPNLYWVAFVGKGGNVAGGEFQPKELSDGANATSFVPGKTTRLEIHRLVGEPRLIEGWDEYFKLGFELDSQRVEAELIFGLLQKTATGN